MEESDDDDVMEALQGRLRYVIARLNHDQRTRDALAGELAQAEQLTGTRPPGLVRALDQADYALLAAEADVLEAELTLMNAADQRIRDAGNGEVEV